MYNNMYFSFFCGLTGVTTSWAFINNDTMIETRHGHILICFSMVANSVCWKHEVIPTFEILCVMYMYVTCRLLTEIKIKQAMRWYPFSCTANMSHDRQFGLLLTLETHRVAAAIARDARDTFWGDRRVRA